MYTGTYETPEEVWDVVGMWEHVDNTGIEPIDVPIGQFLPSLHHHALNPEYALTVAVSPGLAVDENGTYRLIDGHHRLYKADMLGWDTFPVYVIPAEDVDVEGFCSYKSLV